MLRGFHAFLETKAPLVDERCHGDVESAVGLFRDLLGQREDLRELRVELHGLVVVHGRDDAMLVEGREGGIHLVQLSLYLFLQIFVVLIGDAVCRSKDEALVVLIGGRPLPADDDGRGYDEKGEEEELEDVFLFHGVFIFASLKGSTQNLSFLQRGRLRMSEGEEDLERSPDM